MVPVVVEGDLVDRLLSPADPALRGKVLTDLLECPPHHPDVISTQKRIPEQPWVKATLDAHNGDGTWGRGFYHKYDGTSWVLWVRSPAHVGGRSENFRTACIGSIPSLA
jgi:hypothetical protein